MNHFTEKRGLRILPLAMWLLLYSVGAMAGTLDFGAVPAPQKSSATVEDHLKKSQAAYDAQKYGEARKEAREALKLKKDSPEANFLLALVSKGLNKPGDAMKYAKTALQYRNNYAEPHYLIAVLFYEKNDLKSAAPELNTAIQMGERFPSAFLFKGTLELLTGQKQVALDSFREALRLTRIDDPAIAGIKQRIALLEELNEYPKYKGDPSYILPKPLNAPAPRYTEDARKNHIRGKVTTAVLVNENGAVANMVLLTSIGHGLDEEALKAASRLRFSPATKDGKPIGRWVMVQIEFNIR